LPAQPVKQLEECLFSFDAVCWCGLVDAKNCIGCDRDAICFELIRHLYHLQSSLQTADIFQVVKYPKAQDAFKQREFFLVIEVGYCKLGNGRS
jgi:hypothetical protein